MTYPSFEGNNTMKQPAIKLSYPWMVFWQFGTLANGVHVLGVKEPSGHKEPHNFEGKVTSSNPWFGYTYIYPTFIYIYHRMYCEMTLILGHYTYLRLSTHLLEHSPTYIFLILRILTFALTSNDELCGLRLLGSVKFAFFLQGIQRNGAQRSTKSTWDLDLWNGIGVFWRFFCFGRG